MLVTQGTGIQWTQKMWLLAGLYPLTAAQVASHYSPQPFFLLLYEMDTRPGFMQMMCLFSFLFSISPAELETGALSPLHCLSLTLGSSVKEDFIWQMFLTYCVLVMM